MNATEKTPIIGLSRQELTGKLAALGFEPFRASQVWHWVYTKGATDFSQMTTIARERRALLEDIFAELRSLILQLRPPALERDGLAASLA